MNPSHELAVLKAMAEELPAAILAEGVFWPLGGPSDFPQLSMGMVLLTRTRLQAAEAALTPAQCAEREAAERACETTLARWPVAAENKAAPELRVRVNSWAAFLRDCREANAAEAWPSAVTHRAIAALLLQRFPRLAETAEAQRLPTLDAALRAYLRPGRFVWAPDYEAGFPPEAFWFLHISPPEG
jgi:hypothetical protein